MISLIQGNQKYFMKYPQNNGKISTGSSDVGEQSSGMINICLVTD